MMLAFQGFVVTVVLTWRSSGQRHDSEEAWVVVTEGSDIQEEQCVGDAKSDDSCHISLRQLRGEKLKGALFQAPLAAEESAYGPDSDLLDDDLTSLAMAGHHRDEAIPSSSLASHKYTTKDIDYRPDAEAFLQKHATKSTSCLLPHVSLAEALDRWEKTPVDDLPANLKSIPGMRALSPEFKKRATFAETVCGGKPCILDNITDTWPARSRWANSSALVDRFGDHYFELKSFLFWNGGPLLSDQLPPQMDHPPPETLKEYLALNESNRNFIVFISDPIEQSKTNIAVSAFAKQDLEPLPPFAVPANRKHGLLTIDGVGSSAGFHNHDAVWNAQVTGRKAWFLMPPDVPHVGQDGPPLVDGHIYDHVNACEFLTQSQPPPRSEMCILEPGDTIVLPHKWWHATCGLDELTAGAGGFLNHEGWMSVGERPTPIQHVDMEQELLKSQTNLGGD